MPSIELSAALAAVAGVVTMGVVIVRALPRLAGVSPADAGGAEQARPGRAREGLRRAAAYLAARVGPPERIGHRLLVRLKLLFSRLEGMLERRIQQQRRRQSERRRQGSEQYWEELRKNKRGE